MAAGEQHRQGVAEALEALLDVLVELDLAAREPVRERRHCPIELRRRNDGHKIRKVEYDLAAKRSEWKTKFGKKRADGAIRRRVALHKIKGRAFANTIRRVAEEAELGGNPGPAASILKYYGTEHNKARFELMVELLGLQALGWAGDGFSPSEIETTRGWLRSKGNSIEGGTSEVQLNIIAKRVLGLPDE